MNCPHCGEFVPENNYRCPNCKKAVQETVDPMAFRAQQASKQRSNSQVTSFIMIVVVISLAILAYLMFFKSSEPDKTVPAQTPPKTTNTTSTPAPQTTAVRPPETAEDTSGENTDTTDVGFAGELNTGSILNQSNPGGEVQIENFVQGDQITIFNFHSPFSPLCMKYTPWLYQLDNKRVDIVVFQINVNRPGISGIDIRSPVAQQFGLTRLPYFIVYRADGTRSHEGLEARNYIEQLIKKEGIAE